HVCHAIPCLIELIVVLPCRHFLDEVRRVVMVRSVYQQRLPKKSYRGRFFAEDRFGILILTRLGSGLCSLSRTPELSELCLSCHLGRPHHPVLGRKSLAA